MSPLVITLFVAASLLQRFLEMVRHDGNLWSRKPHWTAPALSVVLVAFCIGSAVEFWLAGRPLNSTVTTVGAILFVASFLLRRWVLRSLGALWAIDIDIKRDHELRTGGPYRYCRHPNYLAMLLELIGTCLVANAYWTLAVSLPVYAVLLVARVRKEEQALVQTFGDGYRAYQKKVWAIVPSLRSGCSRNG